jgi:hypothetical protein
MSDPTGKILKDYEPTSSALQGGLEFRVVEARPSNYDDPAQGFFDSHRGTKNEDGSPLAVPSAVYHPWMVMFSEADPVSWDVVGDPVWTQAEGGSISTLWFSDAETGGPGLTNVIGDVGYILLKIIRDDDSREATEVFLEFADEVPESDYYNQYRVIAYVDSEADEPILQKQFEEIRIFEDLAVVNGAFQLVGLEMSHRNYYEPPSP